ncbi:MAG TPA: ATP-binding protein [Desulfobacterales bacterium]|nr:ATP-binding protein [Desulfobacterales bacterium]
MKNKKFWTGVPPWVLIGSAAVLLPIFTFMTMENVHREKEFTTRLLLEKGAALIRAFEAGTRTGMMGMQRGGFQLQRLLTETAQQPDIAHLIVADADGTVVAASDLDQVGAAYGKELDLASVARSKALQWRLVSTSSGVRVFEVFRKFEPTGPQGGMMRRHPGGAESPPDAPRVIFVGLYMAALEEARQSDVGHAIVMGGVLLLIGFAGITLLLLAQSHRATRATLSRIKAFSDHVVENMPIGLVATDGRGRIAVFNQVAESVLRLSASDALGREASRVLPPELWQQVRSDAAPEIVTGTEIDCVLADLQRVPLEVGAGALRDESGRFEGSILLFKDLTEVRALRREVARHQRLATVGRLAAGVAHEIRNPLSSIKGFATYFRERYHDNPQDAQTAAIMIQEVDRLNRVVSQLLEFARPVNIIPRPTAIAALIADSLKLIETQAREKSIAVAVEDRSTAAEARLDADRLNQVLLNLYLNAVEAMAPGGTLTVRVADLKGAPGIEISVSDTGDGIRPEDLSHVFDPYFTTKPAGTGLGLAIAHNIMETMGGGITVASRPGAETTFTLRVPLVKAD